MKKRFSTAALLLTLLCVSIFCHGQMEIRIRMSDTSCDSIKIQSFNWKKKSGTNLVKPYEEEILFKSKVSLKPGSYWITADSTVLGTLLLSSEKKQKITITITSSGLEFSGSSESTIHQQYEAQLKEYEQQLRLLDETYKESRHLPAYMLRTLADSLTAQAQRIQQHRRQYEAQLVKDHPGTLLASIVKVNAELPEIPFSLYGDSRTMQAFVMAHFFDDFPWEDPRIFNTPDAERKFENYTHLVYEIDRTDLDTLVIEALKASSVNPTSHRLFFERLDKDLGFYMSNYKTEHTYIKMLKYVLGTSNLEQQRRLFYEKELVTINKNLEGDIANDFRMVTGNGDTTTLHALQSEFTLLFLHNPNCHTCHAVREKIAGYPNLNNAISSGRLTLLTVYFDNDATLWNHYLKNEANPHYVHGWNFDQSIEKDELYETRTIPYMFLLDKEKRIIRKNILVNEIEPYIEYLLNTKR